MTRPSAIVQKGVVASLFARFLGRRGYRFSFKGRAITTQYEIHQLLVDLHDFLLAVSAVAGQCDIPDVGKHEFTKSKRSANHMLYRYRLASVLDDYFRKFPEAVNLTQEVDLSTIDDRVDSLIENLTEWRNRRASGYVSSEDRKYL
jgi:hypothetical protein